MDNLNRIVRYSLAGASLIFFGLLAAFAPAAQASSTYTIGATGSNGSGNCSFNSVWNNDDNWPRAISDVHRCSGTLMGDGMTNPCVNRGGLKQVFWLGDQNSVVKGQAGHEKPWWIKWYEGDNDNKTVWLKYVRSSMYSTLLNAGLDDEFDDEYSGEKTLLWVCGDQVTKFCRDVAHPMVGKYKAMWYGKRREETSIPAKIIAKGEAASQEWCFLNCPVRVTGNKNINEAEYYVKKSRSGAFVPSRFLKDGTEVYVGIGKTQEDTSVPHKEMRGNFCAVREPTSSTRSITKAWDETNNVSVNALDGAPAAFSTRFTSSSDPIATAPGISFEPNASQVANANTGWGETVAKIRNGEVTAKSVVGTKANAIKAAKAQKPPTVKLDSKSVGYYANGGSYLTKLEAYMVDVKPSQYNTYSCYYSMTESFTFRLGVTENLNMYSGEAISSSCPSLAQAPSSAANQPQNPALGVWYKRSSVDGNGYSEAVTPKIEAAYSSVNVHCNVEGVGNAIDKLSSAINNGVEIEKLTPDAADNWSGSAITNTVVSDDPASVLPWGAAAGDNPKFDAETEAWLKSMGLWQEFGDLDLRQNTDATGFYDKECAFAGVRQDAAKASQVTVHNRSNDLAAGQTAVDLFAPEDVVVNGQPIVKYNNEDAVSTTATRWSLGTPYADGVAPAGANSVGGAFRMTSKVKADQDSTFFNGELTAPGGQKNWSVDTFQSREAGVVKGEANEFYVGSTWASEDKAPQVLTFKYEYEPTVYTKIPVELGFDSANSGYARDTTEKWIGTKIQGKIMALHGEEEVPLVVQANGKKLDQVKTQSDNTGSAIVDPSVPEYSMNTIFPAEWSPVENFKTGMVENKADRPLFWGDDTNGSGKWATAPEDVSSFYRVLKFNRTVAN